MKQVQLGGKLLAVMIFSGVLLLIGAPVLADDAIVVKFKDIAQIVAGVHSSQLSKAVVLHVSNPDQAIASFKHNPNVEFVERDVKRYLMNTPNDPDLPLQYYLNPGAGHINIGATKAWNITTGSKKVIVAVIDSGIDWNHDDLENNLWTNAGELGVTAAGDVCWTGTPENKAFNNCDDDRDGYVDDGYGWNFADNNPVPVPSGSSANDSTEIMVHGTHVAGIIGASGNNGMGITGINWNVSIMPLKVFHDDGSSDISAIYNAIIYAINHGARVLNMSYGGYDFSDLENSAIQQAYADGVLSVAAAGNEATNLNVTPEYPACYPHVLTVAATTAYDTAASFTNYGTNCVGMAAPGVDIFSTLYTNYYNPYWSSTLTQPYGYMSGTSMATPMVVGAAALLKSINFNLSPDTLISLLEKSADPLNDFTLGSGRLNLAKAVVAVEKISGPIAPVISAYSNPTKTKTIFAKQRTRDTSPYFTWSVSNGAIRGYEVFWGTDKLDPAIYGHFQKARSFRPSNVHGNNVIYYLNVRMIDKTGRVSSMSTFRYRVDTQITRPSWGTVVTKKTGVRLRWHQSSDHYVQWYRIYRNVKSKQRGVLLATVPADQAQFIDQTVKPGHVYYYSVQAIDDLGNKSKYSSFKRART